MVIPIGLTSSFKALPKGKRVPRGSGICVRIGEPIAWEDVSYMSEEEHRDHYYDAVSNLIDHNVHYVSPGLTGRWLNSPVVLLFC